MRLACLVRLGVCAIDSLCLCVVVCLSVWMVDCLCL